MPQSIVSDRDPVFTSRFWSELFRLAGVQLHMSSAFHPQSDGQTESVNRINSMYLRCLTGDRPVIGFSGSFGLSFATIHLTKQL